MAGPNYGNGGTFDYGNVLRNVSEIQNRNALTENRLDPNSMDNRLRAAQIEKLEREAAGGGGKSRLTDPAAIEKEMQYLRYAIAEGYPQEQIDLIKQGISKNLAWMSNGTLNRNANAESQIAGAKRKAVLEQDVVLQPQIEWNKMMAGQQAQANEPLGGGNVSRADIEGQIAGQKITSAAAATEALPETISKNQRILADNIGVVATIDDLLTEKDGRTALSYAYGRTNAMLPDWMKTEQMVDSEALRNRVVASVQLENVKKLKGTGPITENEQKILANAASVLNNPLISVELAEKEMRRVKAMFATWSRENEAAIARGELDPNWAQGDSNTGGLSPEEEAELRQLEADKAAGKF